MSGKEKGRRERGGEENRERMSVQLETDFLIGLMVGLVLITIILTLISNF